MRWGRIFGTALFATSISLCGQENVWADAKSLAEARAVASEFWQKIYVKCGNDYYIMDWTRPPDANDPRNIPSQPFSISEYKDLSFVTEMQPLSGDDKLNNIEWRANIGIKYRSERGHLIGEPWSDWGAGVGAFTVDIVEAVLEKRDGSISYYLDHANNMPPRLPTCDEVMK